MVIGPPDNIWNNLVPPGALSASSESTMNTSLERTICESAKQRKSRQKKQRLITLPFIRPTEVTCLIEPLRRALKLVYHANRASPESDHACEIVAEAGRIYFAFQNDITIYCNYMHRRVEL